MSDINVDPVEILSTSNLLNDDGILPYKELNCSNKGLENDDSQILNMWIAENYCSHWGIKEGLREFLQNQFDGMIIKVGNKKNICVERNENDFDFFEKNQKEKIGGINYISSKEMISIWNKGIIRQGDFLFGSSKEEIQNKDIIGRFGEGMKLGILALSRLNKNVTIFSHDKVYNFFFEKDDNFIQNNESKRCLFCKIEKYNLLDMYDKVNVQITNIKLNEWKEQIINYLWLIKSEAEIYPVYDGPNNEIGEILLEEYLYNKIYCKGIFVENEQLKKIPLNGKEKKTLIAPGFNLMNLKLDRDRNSIQDYYEKKKLTSKLLANFMNQNVKEFNTPLTFALPIHDQNKKKERLKTSVKKLNTSIQQKKSIIPSKKIKKENKKNKIIEKKNFYNVPSYLIELLTHYNEFGCEVLYADFFNSNLSVEGADFLWEKMNSNDHYKGKQPISNQDKINKFIEENKLPKEFYPFYVVKKELEECLKKSKHYISIEEKFRKYIEEVKIIEPEDEYNNALDEVTTLVKKQKPNFIRENIIFKEFEINFGKDFCYGNNYKVYFSSLKLKEKISNEWKVWILMMTLEKLNIKIANAKEIFGDIFKKNDNILNQQEYFQKLEESQKKFYEKMTKEMENLKERQENSQRKSLNNDEQNKKLDNILNQQEYFQKLEENQNRFYQKITEEMENLKKETQENSQRKNLNKDKQNICCKIF